MITQRPAAVAKEVLNQCGTLFCFRQSGAHDRKAIRDWVVSKRVDVDEMVDELPSMPTGQCFLWSPEWLDVLAPISIAKKRTFDSSATPEFGVKSKAGKLAAVDIEKFKVKMADAVERARESDPDELRKRVKQLEVDLAKARKVEPAKIQKVEVQEVRVPYHDRAALLGLRKAVQDRLADVVKDIVADFHNYDGTIAQAARESKSSSIKLPVMQQPGKMIVNVRAPKSPARRDQPDGSDKQLGKCERAILTALKQHERLSLQQACIIAGYALGGNTRNIAGALRSCGYADGSNAAMTITQQGADAVGDVPALPTGQALMQWWIDQKLGLCEGKILSAVAAVYSGTISLEDACEHAGYELGGSTRNIAGKLRTLGLIQGKNSAMRLAEELAS